MGKHKNRNKNINKVLNKCSENAEEVKADVQAEAAVGEVKTETPMATAVTAVETSAEIKAQATAENEKASETEVKAEATVAETVSAAVTETAAKSEAAKAAADDAEDEYDEDEDDDEPAYNRRNVNRIKKMILGTVAALILIPTTLSIALMFKVSKLQKELNHYKKEAAYEKQINDELMSSKNSLEKFEASNTQAANTKTASEGDLDYQISIYSESKNNLLQGNEADNSTAELNVIERSSTENVMNPDNTDKDSADAGDNEDADDTSEAEDKAEEPVVKLNGKKVYLTFDDGPSAYTSDILDVLSEKGVKATFFVVGKEEKYYPDYKRIVDEGHTLAMHSYSHVYKQVYASLDDFKDDVERLHRLIYNVTGYDSKVYRFPGGSSNTVANVNIQDCMAYLEEKGYVYFDWNAQNGDAVDYYVTPEQLNDNVMSYVRNNKGDTVVLMHDLGSHYNTIEALPDLIDTLQEEGYEILPITEKTTPVRHVQFDPAKTTKEEITEENK